MWQLAADRCASSLLLAALRRRSTSLLTRVTPALGQRRRHCHRLDSRRLHGQRGTSIAASSRMASFRDVSASVPAVAFSSLSAARSAVDSGDRTRSGSGPSSRDSLAQDVDVLVGRRGNAFLEERRSISVIPHDFEVSASRQADARSSEPSASSFSRAATNAFLWLVNHIEGLLPRQSTLRKRALRGHQVLEAQNQRQGVVQL